jgi:N-acetylglucosaminyldiphosphoundecaprenol N-acetyl-beta-D-mannosaminyltransferase
VKPPLYVAGLPAVDATIEASVAQLVADARARTPRVYVFVNAFSATLRRQEPAYAALLANPSILPLADGAPLAYGAFLTGQGRVARAPGPDVFDAACRRLADEGLRIALVGGMPGTAQRLAEQLKGRHQGLDVRLAITPPVGEWTALQTTELVTAVRASGADVVWLGVSAPRQEIWAVANIAAIGRPVLCVGAAFDFLSGLKPRAPEWMRRIGLEWLFRLGSEPGRLWKRYLIGNAIFLSDLVRYRSKPPTGESRRP